MSTHIDAQEFFKLFFPVTNSIVCGSGSRFILLSKMLNMLSMGFRSGLFHGHVSFE